MFDQQAQQILEHVSDAVVVFDLDWRYIYLNRSAEELLKKQRVDVLGRTLLEISPQGLDIPLYQHCLQAVANQQAGEETFFSSRAQRWLKASYYPSTSGLALYFADYTTAKIAEEAQLRSEVRLRKLVDANLIGIIFWAMDGLIFDANDAFLHMLQYTQEDLDSGHLNWRTITPPEYREQDDQVLEEIRSFGETRQPFEKEYLRKDGERVSVLIKGAMIDHSEEEGVAFVLDISERKKVERMKDDFISMASHELKTPLTSIKGFIQMLNRRLQRQGDEQGSYMVGRMELQINRLTQMVNELLDLSKVQSGGLSYHDTLFDLCELIIETRFQIQRSTSLDIQIEGEQHLPLFGDRRRIAQVFTNLLNNAIKYSNLDQKIIIHMRKEGNEAIVSVQDFGIGIGQEHLAHIFERFYRVNDEYEMSFPGLGIGLFIAREIVKRHKGTIEVESQKGVGSTFAVHLPLVQKDA